MGTVVTGGGGSTDNTGTGIAAGKYAHSEGRTTAAAGDYSHSEGVDTLASARAGHAEGESTSAGGPQAHAEGTTTSAAGTASHAEGNSTLASGAGSHAEGQATTASGTNSHAEGSSTDATGTVSHAEGFRAAAIRLAQHAKASFFFTAKGDAQTSRFTAGVTTTDATPTIATFAGGSSATLTGADTNVLTIPVNRAHRFNVDVVARRSDVSGDVAGWEFKGLIGRGASGDAVFVGSVVGTSWGSAGAAAWDVTLTIDTSNATNNYLKITVTGEVAKTIRWVARIDTTEVG